MIYCSQQAYEVIIPTSTSLGEETEAHGCAPSYPVVPVVMRAVLSWRRALSSVMYVKGLGVVLSFRF